MDQTLLLQNQICFKLYACTREMTKLYAPLLQPLGVTYSQYLVLLVLWEHEKLSVKSIGEKLFLDSGTLTPMLKRMEEKGLISRVRSEKDERIVEIMLTNNGQQLKHQACDIPERIVQEAGEHEALASLLKELQIVLTKVNMENA
ncbi:MarR family winged helix-turn-helix transcriptional regulator [Alkalihalobacterium bogoriense]|uniref:MarR family winged helix-turn-helix transcriptional regulator n=1 Tax=Alkalihalobacterium bogoriense TaxID=246272 RepID=UPI00047A5957|nr:MarR family transcriptional regulator [Alkalihalobacterium bogoriense]